MSIRVRRTSGNSHRDGTNHLKENTPHPVSGAFELRLAAWGFVRYLAVRVAEQQQVIANLVTVDSEQRLGKTLLQLSRTLVKKELHGFRIETKISHEELSDMVGTTRPRISMFMERFRKHGLLEKNREHFLIVKEKNLTDYLALRVAGHSCALRDNSFQNRPVIRQRLFPKLAERHIESI